jgi:hypothetical protein
MAACTEPVSTAPLDRLAVPPVASPPVAPPAPAPEFPPLSRSGTIYKGDDDLYARYFGYHESVLVSRYVFYDDSTFGLQFSSQRFGYFEYTGRYGRADSLITFAFDGSSIAGPWDAIGKLRGDSLSVAYNELMQHSDFLDGVYVRAP